jgi:hypothetical protein
MGTDLQSAATPPIVAASPELHIPYGILGDMQAPAILVRDWRTDFNVFSDYHLVFALLLVFELASHHSRYVCPFLPDSVSLDEQLTFKDFLAELALVIYVFPMHSHYTSPSVR